MVKGANACVYDTKMANTNNKATAAFISNRHTHRHALEASTALLSLVEQITIVTLERLISMNRTLPSWMDCTALSPNSHTSLGLGFGFECGSCLFLDRVEILVSHLPPHPSHNIISIYKNNTIHKSTAIENKKNRSTAYKVPEMDRKTE